MTVYDLNRDQLKELKQHYLTENLEEQGYGISYDVLADADNIISNKRIYEIYADTEFSPDDFACTAGGEQPYYRFGLGECMGSPYQIAEGLRQIADELEEGYDRGVDDNGTSWWLEIID